MTFAHALLGGFPDVIGVFTLVSLVSSSVSGFLSFQDLEVLWSTWSAVILRVANRCIGRSRRTFRSRVRWSPHISALVTARRRALRAKLCFRTEPLCDRVAHCAVRRAISQAKSDCWSRYCSSIVPGDSRLLWSRFRRLNGRSPNTIRALDVHGKIVVMR
jgi:hypothetical protein